MEFEWDTEKAQKNYKKHGVPFEEAATVFYDALSATFDDNVHSIGEHRLITVGFSSVGRLLVVSHTERGKAIRIISARPATARERIGHET
ncbi:MAG: BrnT family toxin [Nitrospirota bacterium]